MEFFATCPKGFERLLADELRALRVPQVRPLRGQVAFGGELEDAYRACLWSRLASRVLLVLARVGAGGSDALYEGVGSVAWEGHLAPGATFAVDAHGTNAQLRNTQFVALRAKDAIVDRVFGATGARPVTNTARPDLTVDVRISGERAAVSLDLAGEPLFRRGYDSVSASGAVPLRPDYASALLAAGGWGSACCEGSSTTLVALWAGQGSLLVEAVGAAQDRAPGLLRSRWGFQGWAGHDAAAWERLVAEAVGRAATGAVRACPIVVADDRPGVPAACRQALRAAGVGVEPAFCSPADAAGAARDAGDALVACDLSWVGERDLAAEAAALAAVAPAAGLRLSALVRDASLDAALRGEPESVTEVMVGRDPATIRVYGASDAVEPPATVEVAGDRVPVLVAASDQFARRLARVARLRARWARREDVTCYRVYDADLPDYAVAIDLYEGSETPGRWLQVSEYAAPREVDPALARRRLLDVLAIAPRVMGVAPADVSVRVRTRSRGGSQYAGEARQPERRTSERHAREGRGGRRGGRGAVELPAGSHLVDEGGLTFEVNFDARHDCGIFLDHRETRSRIREMMKETRGSKRFLNLFAYTGTATCYAADGGARHTTTVDLSRPSLEWARRNMARNGFDGPEHEYVQADVLSWVSEQRHTRNRWDLIFCDVPTFSNSARMRRSSFDVQRDHVELVIGVSRLLVRGGRAIFSCNLRGFRPDVERLERGGVRLTDITDETIPEDFSRNRKVHHAYLVERVGTGAPEAPSSKADKVPEPKARTKSAPKAQEPKAPAKAAPKAKAHARGAARPPAPSAARRRPPA